ncbi:hypothetical protein CK203_064591 [Vitis vinifera]|uniref:Uncharacterized protein n=1 Tax=Vitis vinifera TaxID=29760 RepID=A0A438FPR4_VITVI|nr:hypothetical protein CK203_064591 [Vitis vinifera]
MNLMQIKRMHLRILSKTMSERQKKANRQAREARKRPCRNELVD